MSKDKIDKEIEKFASKFEMLADIIGSSSDEEARKKLKKYDEMYGDSKDSKQPTI